jgi:hypothetical protein
VADLFEVKRFAIFDQFPYTHHIECGVYLQQREGAAATAGLATAGDEAAAAAAEEDQRHQENGGSVGEGRGADEEGREMKRRKADAEEG